ncbi:MAG TPA: FAD-dependent oxidoreductase, partial [Longimicrobiales bacterium]|nr:FAD-dependent oxidoreductase [Longimicrobiales bacterium]
MTERVHDADVLVVGAGAAGLMAALFAAREGAHTLLLERTPDGGRKILISGGGRCNVLPGTFRPGEYVTASSPNTLKKILRSWPLTEQRAFFQEELGIPLKHEADGDKLFPVSDRARDVRDALVGAVLAASGEIHFGRTVTGIEPAVGGGAGSAWRVDTEEGVSYRAGALVVATGGLSVAATGSDGRGLAWARRLGHVVNDTYPALTPLLADPPVHAHLAGVSLVSELSAGARKPLRVKAGFLFTHRGYSG